LITTIVQVHSCSVHRACRITGIARSIYYYTKRKNDTQVIQALQKHVELHPTHGFPKTYAYLRKEGKPWNGKRVHRVYKLLNLNIRRKGKRRLPERIKQPIEKAQNINQTWSIDFMQDRLLNGRKFRTFNVIDDFNREALAIEIDTSITASRVVRTLEQIIEIRGKPKKIRMDNGPEFISSRFELWCKATQIELLYIQPGKPMQNALVERFNGSYRREVLDAYLFQDLWQVKELTIEFLDEYNNRRPHQSLNNMTPKEYLLKCGQLPATHAGADLTTVQQDINKNQ
jgi:putative transposase